MRAGEKKRKRETECYKMQVECLFTKMMKDGNGGLDDEMKVKLVEVLREDEREIQVEKMKMKEDSKEEKRKRHRILWRGGMAQVFNHLMTGLAGVFNHLWSLSRRDETRGVAQGS